MLQKRVWTTKVYSCILQIHITMILESAISSKSLFHSFTDMHTHSFTRSLTHTLSKSISHSSIMSVSQLLSVTCCCSDHLISDSHTHPSTHSLVHDMPRVLWIRSLTQFFRPPPGPSIIYHCAKRNCNTGAGVNPIHYHHMHSLSWINGY